MLRILTSILFAAQIACAVENSVIPTLEYFECVDNLPSHKFTVRQFAEIAEALEKKDDKIRLVTYNMLFNLYDHNLEKENRWPQRLPRIVELIDAMQPDIICTQELYPNQVFDLSNLLNEEFSFFVGQKDEDGESFGIFYRKERFAVLSHQVVDPFSVIQLKDLRTNKTFCVFNTHFAFSNIEKRESQARKIAEITQLLSNQMAVIFTGDLNTFPSRLDVDTLPFYDGDYLHRILTSGPLKNAREQSLIGHFGPISTFTNGEDLGHVPFKGTGTPGVILDHIYVSDRVIVLTHAVEKGTVDGHFPSDHMPVLMDFLLT